MARKLIFLVLAACLPISLQAAAAQVGTGPDIEGRDGPPNVLLIAVDDMGYDTPESFGGWVEGLTPHIDRLAGQGVRFTRAYNTSSRCAPSRGSIMTGLYQDGYSEKPGTSDTTVRADVLTIPEYLREKNYMSGLFGKDTHYRPLEKYGFDTVAPMAAMAVGRSPALYAQKVGEFIDRAVAAGRPFFISANTHDPHRPYAGSPGEEKSLRRRFESEVRKIESRPEFVLPPPVTAWSDRGIEGPGFVPDHELVREEFGYYLNSSHRADQFVGAMIKVLEGRGLLDDTLVIFHSDNGMHWPFAKSNVYVASVKTPFVLYWRGRSLAGSVSHSLVSTIDILPTVLEAAGIGVPGDLPGKSLLPLLEDPGLPQHEFVHATLNAKGDIRYEMRSVISTDYIYIYNKWVDGTAVYHDGQYTGGLALKGFEAAAEENAQAKARLEFFWSRATEELYDLQSDPNALDNLAEDSRFAGELSAMRQNMRDTMATSDDPYLSDFEVLLEQAGHGAPVLSLDFDSPESGPVTARLLRQKQLSLAPGGGVGGSTGLRADYVGYDRGSERIVSKLALPEPGLEFSLNYDVRFEPDFRFVRGGKLHGLGPKKRITGGRPIVPEGWSARVTFREGGGVKLYTYHQDMEGQYGDRGVPQKPFRFEKGRYYSVSLHVRVNDPPAVANGFSRMYVDGELIERHESLRLRGAGGEDTLINDFLFSTFHGGNQPWNAPRDAAGDYTTVHATFDNMAVYRGEHVRKAPENFAGVEK